MEDIKKKFTAGVAWNFVDSFGSQLISFFVSVILARLISPDDYGVIALVFVFINFLHIIYSGGLSEALIITQKFDSITTSSVFYYNLVVSIVLYLLFFLAAPFIADFYDKPILISVIRLATLSMITWSLTNIHQTLLMNELKFKKSFFLKMPGLIISSVIAIWMAYNGWGIWTLVWQYLISSIVNVILFWFGANWHPVFSYNHQTVRDLFKISGKLVYSGIINKAFDNLFPLFIGKIYSLPMLGLYNRANATKDILVNNFIQVIGKVAFPVFAKMKEDKLKLKEAYKKVISVTFFIIAPIMIGGIATANNLFITVYSESWKDAAPLFQLCCLLGLMLPLHVINLDILKVYGRTDLFFKLELFKKGLYILVLLITIRYDISTMILGQIVVSFISLFINSFYSGLLIEYKFKEQFLDIFGVLISSVLMGILVLLIGEIQLKLKLPIILLIQIFSGFVFYIIISGVFQLKPFVYSLEIIRLKFKR